MAKNKTILILCLLFFSSKMVFLQAEEKPKEKRGYIVGTFLTGFGEHMNGNTTQGIGTSIEWINGGTVNWSTLKENSKDITVSLPLMFDMKLMSEYGFGLVFGDLLTISMNKNYQDANHIYYGLSYVHLIKRWDIGASLIVFPVYITDDALVGGKIDASYWIMKNIGISISTIFGGTTGWSKVGVLLFGVLAGISVKI